MRALPLAALLVACGGGAKTAAPAESMAPAAENLKPAPEEAQGGLGCVEPCELAKDDRTKPVIKEAPPPPALPPIWGRLHLGEGPVPGLEAFSVSLKDSANHCGGKQLVTTRSKKKVANTEQALANYYAVEYPLGLDFTEGDKAQTSKATFDAWLTRYVELGEQATSHYEGELANAKNDASMVAAAARLAQISDRFASVLAYAEIPVNVRTGAYAAEATEAFCGRLAEIAEPLLARADQAREACARKAQSVTVTKSVWWQQVCVTPAK